MVIIKVFKWRDSNGRRLISEAASLPTEPQPLPEAMQASKTF